MTQDNMQGVKKALREEADRPYKMAVVPEGIRCGVPQRAPKIWLSSVFSLME